MRSQVDQTNAGNTESRIALGVSVLSVLGASACARRSMRVEKTEAS
jgi:hypothetical protein